MAMLDLVALATVADVAPLTGVNRAFVRQGLTVMAGGSARALWRSAMWRGWTGRRRPITWASCWARASTPAGRIGEADLGARLLATADPQEAMALAERLDTLNTDRREIEARVREAALAQAEARGLDAPLVWAAEEGWHPGVVGIVASRLKEADAAPPW
jgi:single-stranded-DNA-specific exonuclease